jgi:hypothetical protein
MSPQVPDNFAKRVVSTHPSQLFTLDIDPGDIKFETQDPGEKVYVKARASILVNVGWIFNFVFFALLPFAIFLGFQYFEFDININQYISNLVLIILAGFYYSGIITSAFMSFLDWYYDIYLITNERIIHIVFDPLKTYKITEAKLENIELVEERTIGLLPNLFNYGDLRITTAATRGLFKFKNVPDPTWFRDIVIDLSKYVKTHRHGKRTN